MEEDSGNKNAVFRDLTNKKDVVLEGCGEFEMGLSRYGSILLERDEMDGQYTSLFKVATHDNGGYTLTPVNRDLPCSVNAEEVTGEINLINGTRINMANKTMVFLDGPVPKRHRRLPRTPGLPLVDTPPEKPIRQSQVLTADGEEDQRWLDSSWTKLEMSTAEQNWLDNLNTPEQISIMSASYFCKQVRMFTDASLTIAMMDDIFHLIQDAVEDHQDVLMSYLSDISHALSRIPNCTQTRPMHGPAVRLLTRLLECCLEPVSKVILLLDLLRTFSHFDSNLVTMVKYKTSSPVLGSMSIYKDELQVQLYGLDIVAKIAMYRPPIELKPPLGDGCIAILVNAVKLHSSDVGVCRSACRVLANLSSALLDSVNNMLDTEEAQTETVFDMVTVRENLLVRLFQDAIPEVQTMLQKFHTDLGVNLEGRRVIYYYAKLPQLQRKKRLWKSAAHSDTCDSSYDDTQPSVFQELLPQEKPEITAGILKPAGSYECLKTGERRISFVGNTVGGSDSELSTSSSDESFSEPTFETEIPMQVEAEHDFSSHLVKHLIRDTVKKRKNNIKSNYPSDDSTSESSDDELLMKEIAQKPNWSNLPDVILGSSLSDCDSLLQKSYENSKQEPRNFNNMAEKPIILDDMMQKPSTVVTMVQNPASTENSMEKPATIETSMQKPTANDDFVQKSLGNDDLVHNPVSDGEMVQKLAVSDKISHNPETFLTGGDAGSPVMAAGFWSSVDGTNLKHAIEENSDDLTEIRTVSESVSYSDKTQVKEDSVSINELVPDGYNRQISLNDDNIVKRTSQHMADVVDVSYLGKLVRTQIIVHVGSLVFEGDDTQVLLVIDQPIVLLLEKSAAPPGLVQFAQCQYGDTMTLMDLEPAIVISVIDAVRYRTVTSQMVQSAVLSLTRSISHTLHSSTVDTSMLFYRALFADAHLKEVLTEAEFLQTFKTCFKNATERLEKTHTIEDIRKNLSFVG